MKLSIATLTQSNAFSNKPVEKQITWKGNTMTTYVRHMSYQVAIGNLQARNGKDPCACRIASSICDEFGAPVFTIEDVTGEVILPADWKDGDPIPESRGSLDPELTTALLCAIGEVQKIEKPTS